MRKKIQATARASEEPRSGSQQRVGSRMGAALVSEVERGAGAEPTDAEILDWLQSLMKRKGRWLKLVFSDSRDMGYKQDFLSYWSEGGVDGPTRKGNSVREVLSKQMVGAGWKRSASQPRHSATGVLNEPRAEKVTELLQKHARPV